MNLIEIDALTGGRVGTFDVPCPACGPFRKPANRRKKTLRIWRKPDGFATFCCIHCGARGHAIGDNARRLDPNALARARAEAETLRREQVAKSRRKARGLWGRRQGIQGTIAETYLRRCRGYSGTLQSTLGFLPAHDGHEPAMIAAFGLAEEVEPGVLQVGAVSGVHLTLLAPDGSGKAGTGKDKIMLGKEHTLPIVLAPPTDMVALVIAEGIEDALSAHEALGMGAWAAGSADRLPAMAEHIPGYIACVTVLVDNDRDRKGERCAEALAARLDKRRIEARLLPMERLT
jgi:hypothetical protein